MTALALKNKVDGDFEFVSPGNNDVAEYIDSAEARFEKDWESLSRRYEVWVVEISALKEIVVMR